MGNFNITIDVDNIKSRKNHLLDLDSILQEAIQDGIVDFVGQLLEQLKLQLAMFGLADSELYQSVNVTTTDTGVSIMMGSDYAMFVEYGTGVIGEAVPHPNPKHDWEYDTMGHGNHGWWYPTTDDDPNPYKRMGKDGVLRAWTMGMPSRPFMYHTWLWGSRTYSNVINKHINRALKKLESDMK